MRIEQNQPTTATASIAKTGKPAPAASNPTAITDLSDSERLNQALANTPQVRADQVAKARALVADPNYPSQEQMAKVAGLLAANWQREV